MTTTPARPVGVATDMLRSLWWIAAIIWGGLYLLLAVGTLIAMSGGLHESLWLGAVWWTQYLLLAAGAAFTGQYLRHYVAVGVTRRVFGRGVLLFGLISSVLFGVALELGFLIERGLTMLGGVGPYPAAADFVGSPGQILLATGQFSLLFAAYFFPGCLIAAAFSRHGVVIGLLTLVPALVPGLAMDALVLGGEPVTRLLDRLDIAALSTTSLILATAALVVASAAAALAMLRDMPAKTS